MPVVQRAEVGGGGEGGREEVVALEGDRVGERVEVRV